MYEVWKRFKGVSQVHIFLGTSLLLSVLLLSFSVLEIGDAQTLASSENSVKITKNLSLGMTDSQVVVLQQLLNHNPATKIAESGLGSPGNETNYFGIKTQAAVIAFQNLNAGDILVPAEISSGNGYVGPLTIKKLNELSGSAVNPAPLAAQVPNTASNNVTLAEMTDIYVTDKKIEDIRKTFTAQINTALSQKQTVAPALNFDIASKFPVLISAALHAGLPKTIVSVRGQGFTASNNDIYFGPNYIVRNVTATADILNFILPSLPAGRYDMVIKNSNGISNSSFFIVSSVNPVSVTVTSLQPTVVKYDSTVTLSGSGFTQTNNDIVTDFGTIKNVSSPDGKTLTFRVNPEILKELAKLGNGAKQFPMNIDVINDNGYTTTSSTISISF
jgi:peptidoglycan hydrolase-like protein with peptidoglycan-binding domain